MFEKQSHFQEPFIVFIPNNLGIMPKKCAKLTIKGHVQGVGFRYFTFQIARNLKLTGYVKNCSDGSVMTIIQGPFEKINEYISILSKGPPHSHVSAVLVEWQEDTKTYNTFEIIN